ncbi:hypothetical protein [Holophaga foetida]|uniref:hypothetical protein n=1 Tax=Holophaga foetida TaxID=35839 RepID=UPI0002471839|nr:hypothetical protein [Holophaga foetida]
MAEQVRRLMTSLRGLHEGPEFAPLIRHVAMKWLDASAQRSSYTTSRELPFRWFPAIRETDAGFEVDQEDDSRIEDMELLLAFLKEAAALADPEWVLTMGIRLGITGPSGDLGSSIEGTAQLVRPLRAI